MKREATIEDLHTLSEHILKYIRDYEKKKDRSQKYLDMLYVWMRTIDAVYDQVKDMDRFETWRELNKELNSILEKDSEISKAIIVLPIRNKEGQACYLTHK